MNYATKTFRGELLVLAAFGFGREKTADMIHQNELPAGKTLFAILVDSAVISTQQCFFPRPPATLLTAACFRMQIGDRAQELAEACGGRPLAAHMVGTALLSGTAHLEEVLQAVASPGVAHLEPLDRFARTSLMPFTSFSTPWRI